MKKLFISLGLILLFTQSAFATELQGGISFDVNSARQYVQQGQIDDIGPQGHLYYDGNSSNADIIYTYSANNVPIGFNIQYKDDLTTSYVYGMDNRLRYIDKYDKPTNIYPHRGYRYTPDGKLYNTGLTISKYNGFIFKPNGKLRTRIVNGFCYLGNTNILIAKESNY